MRIDFCGPTVLASDGGVSHRATVNGKTVAIRVSMEALQDIDPANAYDDPISQFESNASTLLAIAERKIRNNESRDGSVWVMTQDIVTQ